MASTLYNILLVEDSDAQAKVVKDAVARAPGFRVVAHVPDALAAVAYMRAQGESTDRQRFPSPNIVLLDLNAPRCADIEFIRWATRRTLRPVLAVFSGAKPPLDSKLAEQLEADLYEPNVSEADALNRFLHFAGNIANLKQRGSI